MGSIRQVLPGVHHWTARHPRIGIQVSSYLVEPAGAVLDPMIPDEGLDWFADRRPRVALLTNRHHLRQAEAFAASFGCPIRAPQSGLHEFSAAQAVEGYRWNEEVAPGITALEVGSISPDDGALHVEVAGGALAFADGLVHRGGGTVGFVPDEYMGDDPEAVKAGLRASLRRLLDRGRFEHLLFAHGEPIVRDGPAALRALLDAQAGSKS